MFMRFGVCNGMDKSSGDYNSECKKFWENIKRMDLQKLYFDIIDISTENNS